MKLRTFKPRLTKKALCIILSLIMAFGTFVSMTFGNLLLSDYVDFHNLIVAEAALSPVPLFYRYGELVGLYRLNYANTTTLQYKLGENGTWTNYTTPFSIPAYQTTRVYSRIGTTGQITYSDFTNTDHAIGVYTESATDFETKKPDKVNHGIGLKSVNELVNKYNGQSKFSFENNEFNAFIILHNSHF